MYSVRKSADTGRTAAVELRSLVGERVPLVVAKALTFTAQKAQAEIRATMPKVFDGGATQYTLNSTRVEPATLKRPFARIAVKDRTTNNGTLPENYLLPQVVPSQRRREKRFEKALRLGGLMPSGTRAVLGRNATPDKFGNLKRLELQRILEKKDLKQDSGYFSVGVTGKRKKRGMRGVQPGIYRRDKKGDDVKITPILIFVSKQPSYRPRLDFEGIARTVAQREFARTFTRLLQAATRR
jgi:hypothetical protein